MRNIPSFTCLVDQLPPELRTKPWLVVGKGPSHAKFVPEHAQTHNVIALNHAMRGACTLVGHAVDLEVLEQLADSDLHGVLNLCLPWIPHVRLRRPLYAGQVFFGPGNETLAELSERIPVLNRYREQARLFSYNLVSAKASQRRPDLPLVEGHTFSAAIVFRLLIQVGARTIRTLGVDGGNAYSATFRDIEAHTKLQTTQSSFDIQFEEIAVSIREHDLTAGPLDVDLPARVFVGSMPEQDLAYLVLKYSIRRHASLSVDVQRLDEAVARSGIIVPEPADVLSRGRTPFSFQRFTIPALRKFNGRAIYLDSDMLVLRDIRSLWMHDMADFQMVSAAAPDGSGRPPQFSVMLIDCARLGWNVAELVSGLDDGVWTYEQLLYQMASVSSWSANLPSTWNSLERYEPGHTHLVHFTDMDGQPWLNPFHPLSPMWVQYLLDAVRDGEITVDRVRQEVRCGNVRPSLLEQVLRGEPDVRRLPFRELRADLRNFHPPHRRGGSNRSRLKHELHRVRLYFGHVIRERLVGSVKRTARTVKLALLTAMSR